MTSEGLAILGTVDRRRGLSQLAHLALAANSADRRLARWLHDATDAGSRQPVVHAASLDASDTAAAPNPHTKRAARPSGPGRLDHLDLPPLTADTVQSVASLTECINAVDIARSWLVRNGHNITAVDLRLLTRASLGLTFEIDYLVQATIPTATTGSRTLTERWRQAVRFAEVLQSLAPPIPGAGPASLAAAEAWLRDRLRPHGRWLEPNELFKVADETAWFAATRGLVARLPDLATLVDHSAEAAIKRGHFLDIGGWRYDIGRPRAIPQWVRADPDHGNAADLLDATRHLRPDTTQLTVAAGTTPQPGRFEYDTRLHFVQRNLPSDLRRMAIDEQRERTRIQNWQRQNATSSEQPNPPQVEQQQTPSPRRAPRR